MPKLDILHLLHPGETKAAFDLGQCVMQKVNVPWVAKTDVRGVVRQ